VAHRTEDVEQLRRFATVVSDSNDAVILHDFDGKILAWNSGAKNTYGYSEAEALGMNVREIVAELDRDAAIDLLEKIKAGEVVSSFELRRLTKDGRVLDVWLTTTLLRDESGKPVAIATTERDISERKRAEEALIEKVEQLRRFATVVSDSNDAVILHDFDGKILAWNHGAEATYGYSEAEALGTNVREIVAEPDREAAIDLIEKIKAGEVVKSFELRRVTKDERILDVWLTTTLLRDESGEPVAIATTERDISERKQAETKLRDSERRFRQLANSLPQLVFTCQPDGLCDSLGQQWVAYTGMPEAPQLGFGWLEQLHPDDRAPTLAAWETAFAGGMDFQLEFRIRRYDGEYRWFDTRVAAVRDANGNVVKWFGSNTDITERKQAETALKDKVEELRRFATVVSDSNDAVILHDLDGKILAWNRGAEATYGYSEAEALEMNVGELVAEADRKVELSLIEKIKAGGIVKWFDLRRVTKDGRILDVGLTKTLLKDDAGKPVAISTTERDITERKRAEIALKGKVEELRRFATVVSDSNDAVIMHDFDGKILAWNHGAEVTYGYSEAEALEKNVREIVAELDREAALNLIEKIEQGEVVKSFELRRLTKDGRVLDVWLTTTLLRDESGEPVAIATTERDITERKLAEAELLEARDYLETLLNYANAPIIVWDPTFRVVRFNKAFERLSGRSVTEVLGKEVDVLFPSHTRKQSLDRVKNASVGTRMEVVEIEIEHVDGSVHTLLWNSAAIYSPDGKTVVATIAQGHDITDRKRVESALKEKVEQLRRFATVVSDSNDAVILHDFDGKILAWNHGAEVTYGYSEAEALEKNVREIVAELDREAAIDLIEKIKAGEVIKSFELRRVTKDERILDVWLTTTLLRDESGEPVAIATTERDISERKQAEEAIGKVNAELEQRVTERTAQLDAVNKELETFAYSVSHDLRAPLRHISGFSELLAARSADVLDEESQHFLDTISSSVRQMGVLIDDLLQFSRTGRAEMQIGDVDLDQALNEALELVRSDTAERDIEWSVSPLPHVVGDYALLRQVWANLLGNAAKYTRGRTPARIEVGVLTGGGDAAAAEDVFFVRDNGVGFDMAFAGKLFGVFQRLHSADEFEGTGIGLANVKRIINRLGGRVWPEAELDKGATFFFSLPKRKETPR
jgi:PAS domain S-box-containing protein